MNKQSEKTNKKIIKTDENKGYVRSDKNHF